MSITSIKMNYHYGPLRRGERYEVAEEGYDWFLLKNGIYVPKLFVSFYDPDV